MLALVAAPSGLPLFEARTPWTGPPPSVSEWPSPARAGESVALAPSPEGTVLLVRAPRRPRARALALGMAARRAAAQPDYASLARTLTARWDARLAPAALPPRSAPAECAAEFGAWAMRAREAADAMPGGDAIAPASPPAGWQAALLAADHAAATGDVAAVTTALREGSRSGAGQWRLGLPAREPVPAARRAAWRAWQRTAADSLDLRAAALLAGETPLQRELAAARRDERVAEIAREQPDPYAALATPEPSPAAVTLRPLPLGWLELFGAGALLGAFGAALMAWITLGRRRRSARVVALAAPVRDPAAEGTWLHVVSGPTPRAVTAAALELAAHALARRERVLLVDGSPGLRLHARLGREARWGLRECLVADMPVLGLVQYGGRPGFYLLAHGNPARGDGWELLGRRLDDARPHFGRVILAIDRMAQRAVGDSLLGRALEGWWPGTVEGPEPAASELSARLGIAFSSIHLPLDVEPTLEGLGGRCRDLTALLPVVSEVAEPAPLPAPRLEVPVPAPEPIVLDCDLQVRQRLRFLAWMRRVQSESRRAEAESSISP